MKILSVLVIVLGISVAIALAGSQGSVEFAGLPLFVLCAGIGFALHWLVFVPSFAFQTEHYFDLTGSLSYLATLAVAYAAYPDMDARGLLLCVLIALWAARLGSFLFLRVKRDGQDHRFDEIKTRFLHFLFTWTLGGAWVFITMAAALAAMTSARHVPLGLFATIGVILWLVGFVFEVVADQQKIAFRKRSENKGHFIATGLWSWSRHPNYFGEITLWIGIALIALPALSGWQYVTLISPFFVIFLLLRVSGVPMLEESAQKRWGAEEAYQRYVAHTPVLIPHPPRRG